MDFREIDRQSLIQRSLINKLWQWNNYQCTRRWRFWLTSNTHSSLPYDYFNSEVMKPCFCMSRKSATGTGSCSDVVSAIMITKLCEVTSVKSSKPVEVLSSASIQVASSAAPNFKITFMILKEETYRHRGPWHWEIHCIVGWVFFFLIVIVTKKL